MNEQTLWKRLTSVYDVGEAKAIVRWVLEVGFGLTMADILCGKVAQLSIGEKEKLETIIQRLETGEPVQYIIGIADFCGRQFRVESGVLIPRPETEEFCRWVIDDNGSSNILDIGTGSGCIAITLALEIKDTKLTAWDISDDALRIARDNARMLKASVQFEKKDLLSDLKDERRWDIIVSNPPYIKKSEHTEMNKNVLDYEPHLALFVPEDQPILFYKCIGDYAWQTLNSGGKLYFELNPLTATAVSDYLHSLGFMQIELRQDSFGKQRFLKAIKI